MVLSYLSAGSASRRFSLSERISYGESHHRNLGSVFFGKVSPGLSLPMFHQPPREMERPCFKQLCSRLGAIGVLSMLRSCQQEEIAPQYTVVCFPNCFVQCWITWCHLIVLARLRYYPSVFFGSRAYPAEVPIFAKPTGMTWISTGGVQLPQTAGNCGSPDMLDATCRNGALSIDRSSVHEKRPCSAGFPGQAVCLHCKSQKCNYSLIASKCSLQFQSW